MTGSSSSSSRIKQPSEVTNFFLRWQYFYCHVIDKRLRGTQNLIENIVCGSHKPRWAFGTVSETMPSYVVGLWCGMVIIPISRIRLAGICYTCCCYEHWCYHSTIFCFSFLGWVISFLPSSIYLSVVVSHPNGTLETKLIMAYFLYIPWIRAPKQTLSHARKLSDRLFSRKKPIYRCFLCSTTV